MGFLNDIKDPEGGDYCVECREAGRESKVIEEHAGRARAWGGVPSHWRVCTGCGRRDGPWVKTSDVGEGW